MRSPGRFIVTGSVRSNLDADTWPGTGRLVWVDMYPLTVAEQLGTATRPLLERLTDGEELQPAPDSPDLRGYLELALLGGFPDVAFGGSGMVRRRWLRSYIRQIAERDALDVDPGRDPTRIGRYFEAYALSSAGLARDKTIYTAAGVNRATAPSGHEEQPGRSIFPPIVANPIHCGQSLALQHGRGYDELISWVAMELRGHTLLSSGISGPVPEGEAS